MIAAGHFPCVRKIAAALEVSTKTIWRDFDFLRDRLCLPLEYSHENHGWFYSKPVSCPFCYQVAITPPP